MREDFLHYVWRHGRFDLRKLTTTEGKLITIEDAGRHNHDAGPDFGAAQVRIDGMRWAGNVEIHLRSGQWYDHGHQLDPAYDTVILHVVLEEDRPVYRRNGERIPCLELGRRIPAGVLRSYWRTQHRENWIPCAASLSGVPDSVWRVQLEKTTRERIRGKSLLLKNQLSQAERDWEEVFYQRLARGLGGKVNGDAMESLARAMPLRILRKHRERPLQMEALLFGQAGLLPHRFTEPYPRQLAREYQLLHRKYGLGESLPLTIWRYSRLRPANFPETRVAQLACLLSRTARLFGKALAAANVRELENMFVVELSNYWKDHYRFGRRCRRGTKKLGRSTVRSLLINAVVPAYFHYAELRAEPHYREKALQLLNDLPAEDNARVRRWKKSGMRPTSAAESQGLLELKERYCDQHRCLECGIGRYILSDV